MKTTSLHFFAAAIVVPMIAAVCVGNRLAAPTTTAPEAAVTTPAAAPITRIETPPPAAEPEPIADIFATWESTPEGPALEPLAATLAAKNTSEAVGALVNRLPRIMNFQLRASLAKHLRAVSDPETLNALVPALLGNYGKGNTVTFEISDAIARMAQPDTIAALEALHWQTSTQAGQSHKVLRTVAMVRNPAAKRGLMKLATHAESPAIAAAAEEALKVIAQE